MVGIDHQERDLHLASRRAPPFAIDFGVEFPAVFQAGERVGGCQLLELVLGAGALIIAAGLSDDNDVLMS
jgi:hypothetical protein